MEASALNQVGTAAPLRGPTPLLRIASDERLVAMTRRGNQAAFEALVARYQARLLAFCRHMLNSREDAEDVLQEVFAAAFNAMMGDDRPINVRPWLYRIARNRSLNHLRRAQPIGVDSMDVHVAEHGATTAEKVHKREEFRLLMADVETLPETQRTALLLREIDALSYEQIAEAMDTTIPSVKSLLVRARVSLAEANEARELSCEEVREELGAVAEGLRGRPSAPVRRHVRTCDRCAGFRKQLRATNKALAALFPVGPLLFLKKAMLAQLGTTASAAGSTAAAGAGAAAAGAGASATSAISATVGAVAGKTAAGLAAAALVTAGAVEVKHSTARHRAKPAEAIAAVAAKPAGAQPKPVAAVPQAAPKVVATKEQPTTKLEEQTGAAQAPASATAADAGPDDARKKLLEAAGNTVAAAAAPVIAVPEQQFDTTTLPARAGQNVGGATAPAEPAPATGQPPTGQPQPTTEPPPVAVVPPPATTPPPVDQPPPATTQPPVDPPVDVPAPPVDVPAQPVDPPVDVPAPPVDPPVDVPAQPVDTTPPADAPPAAGDDAGAATAP